VCSARGCAARSERGIAHVRCPIYKNGHDNTNMAPIGFVLVSLAATISILATTKRRRANLKCELCKKLRRRRGISCLVGGQSKNGMASLRVQCNKRVQLESYPIDLRNTY